MSAAWSVYTGCGHTARLWPWMKELLPSMTEAGAFKSWGLSDRNKLPEQEFGDYACHVVGASHSLLVFHYMNSHHKKVLLVEAEPELSLPSLVTADCNPQIHVP